MSRLLRIFVSSPGDVPDERLRADLIIDKLAQDYSRFFRIESYRWEHEPMLASAHFQDAIDPPSKFDIVILILWSRLGTPLPEKTALREYRGLDGRIPVTGTEWEYEDALGAARKSGAPDMLAFRNISPATVDVRDPQARERSLEQLTALNEFWKRHFADRGVFQAAFDEYDNLDKFAARLEESLRKLIERRIAQLAGAADAQSALWMGAPFRGLEAYEFEHAQIFFGRDGTVLKAAEQLAINARSGTAFLLVSGPSGSGKSSLVKAALVPRLMRPQRIQGAAFLRRAIFRPSDAGGDVVLGLVKALTGSAATGDIGLPELLAPGQNAGDLASHLRSAASQPGFVFAAALGHLTKQGREGGRLLAFEEAKLILVVDQLEELFTIPAIPANDRRLFVKLLGGLARSGAVWVVATLRADFWHRAAEFTDLVTLAEGFGRLDVSPPTPSELAEMIRKPAQTAGLSFEIHPQTSIALDALLGEHAASAPGVLPLLSFTLDELYSRDVTQHGGTVLTYATYESLGGLEGAIATRAEELVTKLSEPARAALPRLLRALATVASTADQAPVSRAAPLANFPEGSAAREAVDAFVAARLLVAANEGAVPMVRLAHEALISRWQRARNQLVADRRALETRTLVERQQARYEQASGPARQQLLLRDPDLANAVDLANRWGDELAAGTRDFIQASRRRARLRQRLTAVAAGVFALVAVGAVVASAMAWREQGRAVRAQEQAVREEQRAVTALKAEAESRQRAEESRQAAEESRDSERLTRNFIARVADTLQVLSGVVPEETEALMRQTTQAILSGEVRDPDVLTLQQINALIEMGRHFFDAWDTQRVGDFVKEADERLGKLGRAGAARPEAARLRAAARELAGDKDSIYPQTRKQAERSYGQALGLFERYRKTGSGGELALARVHRKLATLKMVENDDAAAAAHVEAARPLLDTSDEAQSERAVLNDLVAVSAMGRGDFAGAQGLLEEAVALDRQVLDRARQAGRPVQRASAALAAHLQHLGDVLRHNGSKDASSIYEQAEVLATEVLETYPNQDNTRFMLDLIRHGRSLVYRKGLVPTAPAERTAALEADLDRVFGQGFRRFKFGMSIAEVNSLFDTPYGLDPKTLPRAGEYLTGDVRYLWIPLSKSADFRDFYDLAADCLTDDLDYVVFLFHEDSLIRISYRLYGPARPGCRDRRGLLPELAKRHLMPIFGTPKAWRLDWSTKQMSIIGTTLPQGPKLDIVAR
jgi:hypothetical protein